MAGSLNRGACIDANWRAACKVYYVEMRFCWQVVFQGDLANTDISREEQALVSAVTILALEVRSGVLGPRVCVAVA